MSVDMSLEIHGESSAGETSEHLQLVPHSLLLGEGEDLDEDAQQSLDVATDKNELEISSISSSSAPKLWHGGVQIVIKAPIDKVWEITSDRCGLSRWMPVIEVCEKLEGEDNIPGSTRLIRGDILPRIDGVQSWAIEKLVEFDADSHYYTYTVEESNFGMDGYKATFQLNDFGEGTTLVNWFYEVQPMEDIWEKLMAEYMSILFKSSIRRLEELCLVAK